ncbi:MAG: hypothetical protein JWM28_4397 [Chitinophagaceae bacterium]|nr:hypothetical protein [Chitinophagaceae bacterium]
MKKLFLITGVLILFAAEILQVYFIMPFPGSQQSDTIDMAYFLHNYILYIRIAAILLVVAGLPGSARWRNPQKIVFIFFAVLYGSLFYFINFKFLADKMFYQPRTKHLAASDVNKVATDKLVLGVSLHGESKAYPIEIIGYHHQVQDTIGGEAVIITYCTVCRTGRVYSPFVNGKKESFRLVGMDHFNAMFEDYTTKSWWQQATGIAITGPLKGTALKEIPSQQITLASWFRAHPNSSVLQPDTAFQKQYEDLAGFDKGTIESNLEKRDSVSWKFKSWVIGIEYKGQSKAYDWNTLVAKRIINDSLPQLPVIIALEADTASYHVWSREINHRSLQFEISDNNLKDLTTHSTWNLEGICVEGPLKGEQLIPVQASQEFWHSWETFHPKTSKYK